MPVSSPLRRARTAAAVVAGVAALTASLGVAAPATAAITDNGGAARHDGDQTEAIREALPDGPAKNVILLIGDGMGDSEITVARNYAEGAAGTFAGIDALPLTGQYVHWAVDEEGNPSYASESASTATAWSTGTKTVNGKLGVDYQDNPQTSLLEIAKANGMKTGNVTTSEIQDATPGAEISHVPSRRCYGPDTMANCPAEADAEAPLLGLFNAGNFPVRYAPKVATLGGGLLPAEPCTPNPGLPAEQPTLAEMTTKAIDLLDNEDGFFLQVEGASIDKQDHAANACGQIGETVDLDEAVQVALAFAKEKEDTLVVVTADHAHTSQIVETAENNPAYTVNLLTEEGQPMIVSYGTSTSGSQQHTGAQVRIAGYGPGAGNVVGLSDQTDLFFTAADTLRLERDLASLSADATISPRQEVAPGEEFTVTVTGLDADWQATGLLESDPVDLGQQDVLDGTVSFTATAPEEEGEHTLTVTGAQTSFALAAEIVVTADPAPAAPEPDPTSTDSAAAPIGGGLAGTGGTAPWLLAFAGAGIVVIGTWTVIRHRRRTA